MSRFIQGGEGLVSTVLGPNINLVDTSPDSQRLGSVPGYSYFQALFKCGRSQQDDWGGGGATTATGGWH